ncbi:MAG: ATP-binding protein, partial [Egibacteraceae bacterium]
LGGLLGATTGAPLVATGLVALGIQPARERLQRLANRLLYGERDDPYQAISLLARRLDAVGSTGETVAGVAEAVARALRLPYAAVVAGGETVAAHGRPVADPLRLPLTYQGRAVGELLVAPREPGGELSDGEQRLLADIARQIGVAIHAQRLTADLQRSRERLVSAREEERRRLRRDLHDDLGPALAAAALQLDRARDLASDPAGALLEDAARRLRGVVGDVRVLVEGLRPRALDDLGLVPALRQQAARVSAGHLDVVLDMPEDLGPLPAAVDVAAYRIVSEALSNVARHAAARVARVTIRRDDGLQISVTDDGRGLPDEIRSGVGLTSMRERAEELGGTFTVRPRPGAGTVVEAWLPVPTS